MMIGEHLLHVFIGGFAVDVFPIGQWCQPLGRHFSFCRLRDASKRASNKLHKGHFPWVCTYLSLGQNFQGFECSHLQQPRFLRLFSCPSTCWKSAKTPTKPKLIFSKNAYLSYLYVYGNLFKICTKDINKDTTLNKFHKRFVDAYLELAFFRPLT